MRRKALLVAVLVSATHATGCTLAFTYGAPQKRVVRYETRKQVASIQTVPSGGVVDRDGKQHPAPAEFEATYDVKLIHHERIGAWPFVGLIGSLAVASAGFYFAVLDNRGLLGWPMLGLGLLDGVAGLQTSISAVRNGNARARNQPLVIPDGRPLEVEVRWPNAAPQKASLAWPEQRSLTVVRSTLGTFDEALITWAESGERTPSAEGLFNLGEAYAVRAVASKSPDDARKALAYFARYLETDNVPEARRVRVEQLSKPLEGGR